MCSCVLEHTLLFGGGEVQRSTLIHKNVYIYSKLVIVVEKLPCSFSVLDYAIKGFIDESITLGK